MQISKHDENTIYRALDLRIFMECVIFNNSQCYLLGDCIYANAFSFSF